MSGSVWHPVSSAPFPPSSRSLQPSAAKMGPKLLCPKPCFVKLKEPWVTQEQNCDTEQGAQTPRLPVAGEKKKVKISTLCDYKEKKEQ